MRLPIDTNGMTFIATGSVEPVVDYDTKRPKADADGQPIFQVQLVAMAAGDAEVISVKIAGKRPEVDTGAVVTVGGLSAMPWDMGDRSGVAYRAEHLAVAGQAAKQTSS